MMITRDLLKQSINNLKDNNVEKVYRFIKDIENTEYEEVFIAKEVEEISEDAFGKVWNNTLDAKYDNV